ncbi:MAG TPA: transporter [Bordetella sp.]
MTLALTPATFDADISGLLYAFRFQPGQPGQELDSASAQDALGQLDESHGGPTQDFLWLHFNLSQAGCTHWLQQHLNIPDEFFEMLGEQVHSTRLERQDDALVAVFNDVIFELDHTPSDVTTSWVYAHRNLMISMRYKPLRSIDRLRMSIRRGETFESTADLLSHLMREQADLMVEIVRRANTEVDRVEDRFLAADTAGNRQTLSSNRRVLVRLQRMLAPEPGSVFRLLARPPYWLTQDDVQSLRESTEEFSVVLGDMTGLIERIKLLQEEIAANLQEQNNRTLFVLTLVTVLALPINMVAGLFGMNVGGIPLASDPNGFWFLVLCVIAFTGLLAWRSLRRANR